MSIVGIRQCLRWNWRVGRQSPIIDGELLMRCFGGQLFMKRYVGIDLAEV